MRLRAINLFNYWCPVSWCSGALVLASLLNFSHLIFDRLNTKCWKPLLNFRRFCGVCRRLTESTTKRSPIWHKWKCSEFVFFFYVLMESSHVYLVKFQVNMFLHSKRMLLSFVFSQTFLIKFACLLWLNCVVFITHLMFCARDPFLALLFICVRKPHAIISSQMGEDYWIGNEMDSIGINRKGGIPHSLY